MSYNEEISGALDILNGMDHVSSRTDLMKILKLTVDGFRREDMKEISPEYHIYMMSSVLYDLGGYCQNVGVPVPLKGSWYWFAHVFLIAAIYE